MSLKLYNMLYPDDIKCISCDDELFEESPSGLCEKCSFTLKEKSCLRCGREIKNVSSYCDICQNVTWDFNKAFSAFLYDDKIKKVIYNLKYWNGKYIAKYLAAFLLQVIQKENIEFDCLTFVPIHKKKQRKKGYNHAQLLADELSLLTQKPSYNLLKKIKNTKSLTKLTSAERYKIIKDSLSFEPKDKNFIKDNFSLKDKIILLIDDVFTTGSTSNECAKTLKKSKCADVFILSVASVAVKPMLI